MKVLLAGNTGYVTEEFVEEAFPECQVMVLGNKMIKTVRRRELISRPFPRTELELGDIFRTYEFEAVVYFFQLSDLTWRTGREAENLRKLLQYCRKGVQSHFLYVTGPEGMYDVPTGKTPAGAKCRGCVQTLCGTVRSEGKNTAGTLFIFRNL